MPDTAVAAQADAAGPLHPAEQPWPALATLARGLWLPAIVTGAGTPAARLADLQRWMSALRVGALPPPEADFGAPQATPALRAVCADLQLQQLTRGSAALAEQLLRALLWHLDQITRLQPALDHAAAVARLAEDFRAAWTVERQGWEEVLKLLAGVGDLALLGQDALAGLFKRREWREAQRLAGVLEGMPELVALIERLGRRELLPQAAPAPEPPPPQANQPEAARLRPQPQPGVPGDLRGLALSSRLEAMIGADAVLRLHARGRRLWQAKRAEGRLLAYEHQGPVDEPRPEPAAAHQAPRGGRPPPPPPLGRGPFIVCLDTSASMRGAPETVAKAVVLQALRSAWKAGREAKVIAFGGAGELHEHSLGLEARGLEALLQVLGFSFDGGTDLQAPIERALASLLQQGWRQADLLVVSDGEFGCTPATLAALEQAREHLGLRVQGVLVGDRETLGLLNVADHIHWVRDWRRHGPHDTPAGFSPVHSKSLTALYFPGALSPRAARHRQR